jgi:hypothetical protein
MMTQTIRKLVPNDVVEWPDGERGTVTWVSEDGERFRVEGLPSLLRTTDSFRGTSSPQRFINRRQLALKL